MSMFLYPRRVRYRATHYDLKRAAKYERNGFKNSIYPNLPRLTIDEYDQL